MSRIQNRSKIQLNALFNIVYTLKDQRLNSGLDMIFYGHEVDSGPTHTNHHEMGIK